MKKLNLVLIALVMGTSLFAAPPADYYTSANTKSSETLRLALQDIIDGKVDKREAGYKVAESRSIDDVAQKLAKAYKEVLEI